MAKKVQKNSNKANVKVKSTAKAPKVSAKQTSKPTPKATPKLSAKAKAQSAPKKKSEVVKKDVKTTQSKSGADKKIDKQSSKKAPVKVEVVKSKATIEVQKVVSKSSLKPAKTKKSSEFDDMDNDFELESEDVQAEDFKSKSSAEIEEIRALLGEAAIEDSDEVEIALRDAEGRLYCKVRDCDELSLVDGYCRLHYLKMWKRIQLRKKILTDGKLEKYIEELTQRYPDKYIEMLREDLKSEKSFLSAINELEIEDMNEESNDMDDDQQGLIDEVRGMQTSGGAADDDDGF